MEDSIALINQSTCPTATTAPSVTEYFEVLRTTSLAFIGVIVLSTIATIITCICATVWSLKNSPKPYMATNISLVSIYAIVNLMSLTAVIVPRAAFFCDTITHATFMVCAYLLFSLFLKYSEGETNLIAKHPVGVNRFNVATPPCCCCFTLCLSPKPLTKGKISLTRILILQMSVIQIAIFIVLNVIQINDQSTFDVVIRYFIPFIALTIMLGVWGLNIMVRMFLDAVPGAYKIKEKYIALQLVLILSRLQPGLVKLLSGIFDKSCDPVLPLDVQYNIYVQLAVSLQMFLISLWACKIYKVPNRL